MPQQKGLIELFSISPSSISTEQLKRLVRQPDG